jgi:hypothetical protein
VFRHGREDIPFHSMKFAAAARELWHMSGQYPFMKRSGIGNKCPNRNERHG